ERALVAPMTVTHSSSEASDGLARRIALRGRGSLLGHCHGCLLSCTQPGKLDSERPISSRANRAFAPPLRSQGAKPATAAPLRAGLRTAGSAVRFPRRGTPAHRDARAACPR